jgi:hypothetical protein|tara:strand:- start:263 stop:445 length:183 start_codon:yes stop_codon:yes gene_type:complete
MKPEQFDKLKETKSHLISDAFRDEENQLIRNVEGKDIKQIEEKTEADKKLNQAINLWRMR